MFKIDLSQLLEKEMDRKDFLKHVAVAAIALTGATAVLKALMHQSGTANSKAEDKGYGSSAYGG